MSLVNKIMSLYPELTIKDFEKNIIIKNDLNSDGEYIDEWNHETLSKPTQSQVSILREYRWAVERLKQYVVADGQEEEVDSDGTIVREMIPPAEQNVNQSDFDSDGNVVIIEVPNPLIINDEAERAAAQDVINNTEQAVIDHYEANQ